MLPEPLRQQLGRLKEQGCPAALVERAMGMDVHIGSMIQFTSHSKKFNSIEFQVGNVFIGLHSDGLTTVRVINEPFEERIEIPPPKGAASTTNLESILREQKARKVRPPNLRFPNAPPVRNCGSGWMNWRKM